MRIVGIIKEIDAYLSCLRQARELLSEPIGHASKAVRRLRNKQGIGKAILALADKRRDQENKPGSKREATKRKPVTKRVSPVTSASESVAPHASVSVQIPIVASVSTPPEVADPEALIPKVQVLPMRRARHRTTRPRTLKELDSIKPAIALAGPVSTKVVVVSAAQLQRERERAAPPEVRRPRVPAAGLSGRRAFEALFSDPTDPSEGSRQ